ncbi:hypothetical protein CDAR_421501 [Caerostris darwini]|uniref:Uncharacterized protein n=1 Tax=Caerostris darwini TaxID=1538125 RepID=A0AAV4T1G4_9ARAC|nr:hypothetical protein CDAR_421501 [Caerostris darwini]
MRFAWSLEEFNCLQPDVKKIFPITSTSGASPLESISFFWTSKMYSCDELTAEIVLHAEVHTMCTCTLAVIDVKGRSMQIVKDEKYFNEDDKTQIWILPSLFSKRQWMATKDAYLNNGVLSMKCKLSFSTGFASENIGETYIGPKVNHVSW